jgi:hypothetical protein
VLREAEGLASWLAQAGGIVSAELRELIASALASDSPDEQPGDNVDLDDADILAEIKVSQFLKAVGLPLPTRLAQSVEAAAANTRLLPRLGTSARGPPARTELARLRVNRNAGRADSEAY